ncbi:uncharacterized protein LOC126371261 isoform X3 [Pectinophora gossypiella]|uniref:uncharacterized protein LOC126371261 isoform X3 n=1 Tax=Pectinophora gossypiella TaxID=13191 RepID=UPI00214F51FA|nr:uncharacterized protein LOC126371261 isoform X3 [Pectinophora gossypiella]
MRIHVQWVYNCFKFIRWLCMVALVAACARAAEEDVPDALDGDDDDSELALDQEESRNVHPRAYQSAAYNALPSGFRATAAPSLAELAGYTRVPHQPTTHHQQPLQQHHQQQQQHRQAAQAARLQAAREPEAEREEEAEEEREEPDRLAQLLQQSRFQCSDRQTGYYADEELQCEVFHYCQDGVKHSWICPDGFTFHQVHLICMPPTQENICQQSAKYHIVNKYLYRPINQEEVQRKPNLPLKYSDRYYPAEVYNDDRYANDDDGEEEEEPVRPTGRPAAAPAQVFRSAEEVNIPLVQRRPHNRPYEFRF